MCNQFHRMRAGVRSKFHIMAAGVGNQIHQAGVGNQIHEAGVGAHQAIHIVRTRDSWMYRIFCCLILGITSCLTSEIMIAKLRSDALLNVPRIAGHEAVNTTLDEDLSSCTTSSLKDCTLINNGTWYNEEKNSFFGKLSNYSHFIDNGSIDSCKELRYGDVSEEHGLPYEYYVRQSISIGCSLSVVSKVILALSEPQKVTESIVMGLGLSWLSLLASLLLSSATVVMTYFSGNIVGSEAVRNTFPSLVPFYLVAFVGWMSVFSQRHFLVRKESGTAVSTCGHIWDVIVRWAPYCAYFPAFFLFNWLFSSVLPQGIMSACDVSSWLTQDTLLRSSFPPVFVFLLFNVVGRALLIHREQHLEVPRLKENFLIFSKLFYSMHSFWRFGVLVNEGEFLGMFRFLGPCISLIDVVDRYVDALSILSLP